MKKWEDVLEPGLAFKLRAVGAAIRKERRERGWAQEKFARAVGVSVPTVRALERGDPGVAMGAVCAALRALDKELRVHEWEWSFGVNGAE